MAVPESTSTHFFQTFGPHASKPTGARLDPGSVPDRAVNTHCCFCGQQCGITLLVKDETVIGFEPRYDFPFNQGKLCPKGVKRYLQGSHPDRLLHAYERSLESPDGFRATSYNAAIQHVAEAINRIQAEH